jgi:Kef-type K+ transport system membrane component KefB
MSFRRPRAALVPVVLGTILADGVARASAGPGEGDVLPVIGLLFVVLIAAMLGGSLAARLRQPPVLGELAAGIVLGNLGLFGLHAFDGLRDVAGISLLAEIGVLFLLFSVGLETSVAEMMSVGLSSLVVATLGVIAPMVLGYFCSSFFFPGHHAFTHWFVGATLAATSVGITARVLADLGRTASVEGRIILGAAVIDDVLGLLVLAVVSGLIRNADAGRSLDAGSIAIIVGKALLFLAGAVLLGRWLSRRAFGWGTRLSGEGALLALALAFCFGLAYLAGIVGLAPIVGAFAAGLVLEEVHYRDLKARDKATRGVPELLEPIAAFLVPIFFVLMGARVDLSSFTVPGVPAFALVLTAAAVAGKQVCSLGVLERGVDKLAVGLGMIPRGEVGLIFANIGLSLTLAGEPVIDHAVFSAVVVMVSLTTLMTPPLLTWRLRRR